MGTFSIVDGAYCGYRDIQRSRQAEAVQALLMELRGNWKSTLVDAAISEHQSTGIWTTRLKHLLFSVSKPSMANIFFQVIHNGRLYFEGNFFTQIKISDDLVPEDRSFHITFIKDGGLGTAIAGLVAKLEGDFRKWEVVNLPLLSGKYILNEDKNTLMRDNSDGGAMVKLERDK